MKDFFVETPISEQDIKIEDLKHKLRDFFKDISHIWIFEPNNKSTREELKATLIEFLWFNKIDEFAIVCDESNNTTEIINQNKLKIDLSVRFDGSDKFIYIPIEFSPEII